MSVRTSTIVLALATLAAPAFAQSVFVGGEQGWIDRPAHSSLTPRQVSEDYLAFRRNPVTPDGGRLVGGEMGYVFPAHSYARVNGEWVCTDQIAHNPAPAAIRSPGERGTFQALYPA